MVQQLITEALAALELLVRDMRAEIQVERLQLLNKKQAQVVVAQVQ